MSGRKLNRNLILGRPKINFKKSQMKTLLAIAAIALAGCSSMPKQTPLRTVDHVNLSQFMGDWYVIGTIPWFVEKNNVGTMDIYKLRADGKIDISYAFHKKSLEAPRQEMKATHCGEYQNQCRVGRSIPLAIQSSIPRYRPLAGLPPHDDRLSRP
jgi:hypothetical protein